VRVTSESLPPSPSIADWIISRHLRGLTRRITLRDCLAFWRQRCGARDCDNHPGSQCSRDSCFRLEGRPGRQMLASAAQSCSSFQAILPYTRKHHARCRLSCIAG
jgi:hypothetical protein